MAITIDAGEAVIACVPDARRPRWQKGTKTQITVTIAPELLAQVDAIAHRKHLSRAALLTVWRGEKVQQDAAT